MTRRRRQPKPTKPRSAKAADILHASEKWVTLNPMSLMPDGRLSEPIYEPGDSDFQHYLEVIQSTILEVERDAARRLRRFFIPTIVNAAGEYRLVLSHDAHRAQRAHTVHRNAAGQLVVRRGDGLEFIGPVTV